MSGYAFIYNGIDANPSYNKNASRNFRYNKDDVGHHAKVQNKIKSRAGYEQRAIQYNTLTPSVGNSSKYDLRNLSGVATDGSTFKSRVSLMHGLNELNMHRRSQNPNNDLTMGEFGYRKERGYLFPKHLRPK